ncbi:PriA Primosomal protein N' (replication factor Y) - superfamily II helicase [Candidatus Nanopelagicaceae bacterium]
MIVKGGLKLKRELAPRIAEEPRGPFTVAQVWVDSSVFHLDSAFSYLIPGNLSDLVQVGSLVSVPFHGRDITGFVIGLDAPASLVGLKSIHKVIGRYPLLTQEIIDLVIVAARRYAAHPLDLVRSAIPERVAAVEKNFDDGEVVLRPASGDSSKHYLQLPPGRSRSGLMAQKISSLRREGAVLAILPDHREVTELCAELLSQGITPAILDTSLAKSEFYSNFLATRLGKTDVVIGTRSAIFAPVSNLRSILIYNEGSENFYERRAPGWNVRDIALMRSELEGVNLFFAGYSPSTDISRLIDANECDFKKVRSKVRTSVFVQSHGELLPSRAIPPIRAALKTGPVLFLVPLKGYAQAIRCAKCRTLSRCTCGGSHIKNSATSPISCSHCGSISPSWACVWCQHPVASLAARGADRHQHELGLLFPSVPVQLSTADHPIPEINGSALIIATPGMAPRVSQGYAAVVLLEGNRFLNQPDMRASERVREIFFAHAALAAPNAPVLLVQDEGHSIATAITTWNPTIAIQRDLEERRNLNLPPYVRSALMTMETKEITRLKNALLSSQEEGRIPASTKILGPIPAGDKSALILTADLLDGEELITTLHEFMRRRSAAKKELPSLRIDPYSLSR